MNKRPMSVTVVAWIIIVLSVLGVAGLFISTNMIKEADHVSVQLQHLVHDPIYMGISYAIVIINLIAGIFILKGKGWGRWLYVAMYIVGIFLNFIYNGVSGFSFTAMLPGLVIFVVFMILLFNKSANEYFNGSTQKA